MKAVEQTAGVLDTMLADITNEERPAIGFKEGWKTLTELIGPMHAAPESSPSTRQILMAIKTVYPEQFKNEAIADSFLPRLNHFLVALNDWLDVGEKIPRGHEGRDILQYALKSNWPWLRDFLHEPVADPREAERRKRLQLLLTNTVKQVYFLEHQTQKIGQSTSLSPEEKFRDIKSCQELVNGAEMILNMAGCLEPNLFADRLHLGVRAKDMTLKDLQREYQWLTDPNFPDDELTPNERKARLLFFAQMAVQRGNDNARFIPDVTYGIWKPLTVLTEAHGLPLGEAKETMNKEAKEYGRLARQYGLSEHVTNFGKGFTETVVSGLTMVGSVSQDSVFYKMALNTAKKSHLKRAHAELLHGRVAEEKKRRKQRL